MIGVTPWTQGSFFYFLGPCLLATSRNTGWMDIREVFRKWTHEAIGYTVSRLSRRFHALQTRRGGGLRSRSASCVRCNCRPSWNMCRKRISSSIYFQFQPKWYRCFVSKGLNIHSLSWTLCWVIYTDHKYSCRAFFSYPLFPKTNKFVSRFKSHYHTPQRWCAYHIFPSVFNT